MLTLQELEARVEEKRKGGPRGSHRSRLEITLQILEFCFSEQIQYKVIQHLKLGYATFSKACNFLVENDLITEKRNQRGSWYYLTTQKGRKFIGSHAGYSIRANKTSDLAAQD